MQQLGLLTTRRFAPLFLTQFLGAFNDNLFKSSVSFLIVFRSMSALGLGSDALVSIAGGLFIAPFFLFSASAGQVADKIPKSKLVVWTKIAEVAIMLVGLAGILTNHLPTLLAVLLLMGVQASFFGPAKYSVLPEILEPDELVGGNALIETGTFLAILLGTISAGLLFTSPLQLGSAIVIVAVAGLGASLTMPKTSQSSPHLVVAKNPITPTLETYRVVRENRPVFLSILGISWFWLVGSLLLTVLPSWTKAFLFGDESVVTLLLALFCVGMAIGSLLCERLSRRALELGLVPLGSIGISAFALDLFLAGAPRAGHAAEELSGLAAFAGAPGSLRIAIDLLLIAVFSGFYTVPLYTMIQQRSPAEVRSRVIAGNNILNAAFMVAGSLLLTGLFSAGATTRHVFLIVAVLNLAVAGYIYTVIPEFLLRFVAWTLANVMYRLRVVGRDRFPKQGPAVLVANHVSFVDWLLIAAACPRPARFVMYHQYFEVPVLRFLFRDAKVIPIAPAKEDEARMEEAFDRIDRELEDGEIVCIFPEGRLTGDGKLGPFRPGIERILERRPVPVIPIGIGGMWGSFFSKKNAMKRPFQRLWSRVTLRIGDPVAAGDARAKRLEEEVAALIA
jgi:hypothetical protein